MNNSEIVIKFNIDKQINIQDGDILLIDVDEQEHLEMIGRTLNKLHPDKSVLLIAKDGINDIEFVSEEVMKKYGWRKIDGFAK